jgi:hypothetical protein
MTRFKERVPLHAVHALAVQRQPARLTIIGPRLVPNAQQLLQPLAEQPLLENNIARIGGECSQ